MTSRRPSTAGPRASWSPWPTRASAPAPRPPPRDIASGDDDHQSCESPDSTPAGDASQGRLGVGEIDRGAHHRPDDGQAEPEDHHHRRDDHPRLVVTEAEQQRGGREAHEADHQQLRGRLGHGRSGIPPLKQRQDAEPGTGQQTDADGQDGSAAPPRPAWGDGRQLGRRIVEQVRRAAGEGELRNQRDERQRARRLVEGSHEQDQRTRDERGHRDRPGCPGRAGQDSASRSTTPRRPSGRRRRRAAGADDPGPGGGPPPRRGRTGTAPSRAPRSARCPGTKVELTIPSVHDVLVDQDRPRRREPLGPPVVVARRDRRSRPRAGRRPAAPSPGTAPSGRRRHRGAVRRGLPAGPWRSRVARTSTAG